MKVIELLDSPEKWTQGNFALTKDGIIADELHSKASCFCLVGALRRCYMFDRAVPIKKITQAIHKLFPERDDGLIISFNDHPDTCFADVVAVVREAGV